MELALNPRENPAMVTAFQRGMSGPVGARELNSEDMLRWSRQIEYVARRNRREILVCLGVGLLLDAAVLGIVSGVGTLLRNAHQDADAVSAVIIGGGICALMLLIAALTKPAGRAEQAQRVLNGGFRASARGADPAVGLVAVLAMVIALYGSYCLVECCRRAYARFRVRRSPRDEMARILAAVCAVPVGVPVQSLLKHGQLLDSLRTPVAALLLDGWISLCDEGRIVQRRATLHRPRHPLADVFAAATL